MLWQENKHILSPTLKILAAFNPVRFLCPEVGPSTTLTHELSDPLFSEPRSTTGHRKGRYHGSGHPLCST